MFSMWSDPSLLRNNGKEGSVFYEVCSEATTANATVGVFFVCIRANLLLAFALNPVANLTRLM
jgi:hypothetical protein